MSDATPKSTETVQVSFRYVGSEPGNCKARISKDLADHWQATYDKRRRGQELRRMVTQWTRSVYLRQGLPPDPDLRTAIRQCCLWQKTSTTEVLKQLITIHLDKLAEKAREEKKDEDRGDEHL